MRRTDHKISLAVCSPSLKWLTTRKRSCIHSSRPWGDLPSGVLEDIVLRLSLKDYARFACVCRGWRSLVHPDARPMCLMLLRGDDGACNAVDPSSGKVNYNAEFPELAGARLLSSNRGWLLFQRDYWIFFFDPRTRQQIDFPCLKTRGRQAAFSSVPVSIDCAVVVLDDDSPVSSCIGIWRFWRTDWQFFRFCYSNIKNKSQFYLFGDRFCCLRRDGRFGMFNINRKTWCIYDIPKAARGDVKDGLVYITEFDGGLYLILLAALRKQVRIFRVYISATELVEIERLGNRTIYVDPICAHMRMAPAREMADKIYFTMMRPSKRSMHYYCMRTKRYCSSVDFNMPRKLSELSEEWRGRDDVKGSVFRAWIEVDSSRGLEQLGR